MEIVIRYCNEQGYYDAAEYLSRQRESAEQKLARLKEINSDGMGITRPEDMSPDGTLTLLRQDDGDIIVTVREADEGGFGSSVEFCMSGTQSPRTRNALAELMKAMREDEKHKGKHGPA
jgi:hypothetical protein